MFVQYLLCYSGIVVLQNCRPLVTDGAGRCARQRFWFYWMALYLAYRHPHTGTFHVHIRWHIARYNESTCNSYHPRTLLEALVHKLHMVVQGRCAAAK